MQNPLQITFHDIRHNADVEELIAEKYEKIKAENIDVTKCHLVIEKQSKHQQKLNAVCVRLDLKVAHFEDIIIKENCTEDPASLRTTISKVFKVGLELIHKHKTRHMKLKRSRLQDLPLAEAVETEE